MTLLELKEKIESFQIVQCGLHHEVVRLDSSSGLPLKTIVGGEEVFERMQLCRNRNNRLGCAHSGANLRFKNYFLGAGVTDERVDELLTLFDKTILRIYELDHQKGFLEKDFADLVGEEGWSKKEVRKEINDCILQHESSLVDLEEMRRNLLSRIEVLIAAK